MSLIIRIPRSTKWLSKEVPRTWLFISASWLLGQLIVTLLFDLRSAIQFGGDSDAFISASKSFPNDQGSFTGYIGFIAILFTGNLMGSTGWFLLIIQNTALFCASWCLMDLGKRTGSRTAGYLAAGCLLFNPLMAQWFRYVLTETLFVSGTIVLMWAMYRFLEEGGVWKWRSLMIALAVASIRPNGTILLASVASVLVWGNLAEAKPIRRRLGTLTPWLIAVAVALLLPAAQEIHGEQNSFARRTLLGEVFWNEREASISMPQEAATPANNLELIKYAVDHPIPVIRLTATRLAFELFQFRPRYSDGLNLFATGFTVVFWIAVLIGSTRPNFSNIRIPHASIVVPQALLISATWASPEGRFGWWLIGPSLILAGHGLAGIPTKFKKALRYRRFAKNLDKTKFAGRNPAHSKQERSVPESGDVR